LSSPPAVVHSRFRTFAIRCHFLTAPPLRRWQLIPFAARESAIRGSASQDHIDHAAPPFRRSAAACRDCPGARGVAALFDEPTSALDPELVGEVLGVIRGLAEAGMTMIIVTHEVGFAREVADRIVFMDDGIIVKEGPPERVLDQPMQERKRRFLRMVAHEKTEDIAA
jgi:polar amino acid transport system permease protein